MVFFKGSQEEQEIRILTRGDYFGEQALIKEDKRTANIIALSPGVECLTLDRESFNLHIGDLIELHQKDYGDKDRLYAIKNLKNKQIPICERSDFSKGSYFSNFSSFFIFFFDVYILHNPFHLLHILQTSITHPNISVYIYLVLSIWQPLIIYFFILFYIFLLLFDRI